MKNSRKIEKKVGNLKKVLRKGRYIKRKQSQKRRAVRLRLNKVLGLLNNSGLFVVVVVVGAVWMVPLVRSKVLR